MPIHRTVEGGVAVLTLDLGRGNAIDHAFIDALSAALDAALAEGARAVVITGRGKVFCGGLDLITLAAFDHPQMARFVDAFDDCFRKVLAFPRPVVAAVNGHALAGGAILAFACDHRVAQPGPFQMGLNEVELGISFPAGAFEIARRSVPERSIGAVLMEGRRFSPEEALAAGLVHGLAEDALAAAKAQAARFAAGGVEAVADVKADLVAPVLGRIAETTAMRKERFLTRWFAPEARRRIDALVERLGKRG